MRSLVVVALAASCGVGSAAALSHLLSDIPASEPRVWVLSVWPNRVRYFDEDSERFIGDLSLRKGAVIGRAHTPDFRRFFFLTGAMDVIEVVDTARRAVIDVIELSSETRKVRVLFGGMVPDPGGRRLYLVASIVRLEPDRFIPEDPAILIYDLDARKITESFTLPPEVERGRRPSLYVSADGESLFVFGEDIYRIDAETHEVVDTIVLSQPLLAGYGPYRGLSLYEREPGVFYGVYRTTEPFLHKTMLGVARIDLAAKQVDTFELGPELDVRQFVLSADGKTGYAGLEDLVVVDMEAKRILKRIENFERGRTNNAIIPSRDGKKLYACGVGDTIYVYDTNTFERVGAIFAGGDFTAGPVPVPRSLIE